jgi:hypothetical protein
VWPAAIGNSGKTPWAELTQESAKIKPEEAKSLEKA